VIETLTALAEPNRLRIVELLRSGPRPVGEIVDKLHIAQPQVSKHLRVLKEAKLVEMKPQAQRRVYELRPEPLVQLEKWLERFRENVDARFDRLDAHLEKMKRSRR
jgi:DNA-binding transcriptional ArsR family regulator